MLAHAEDRPAGEVGVHPRGAVHRRHHAPPDDHAGQARRQARRHADRDRGPRRLQHRRLRRPRRRDARRLARQPADGLPLPQQEGRRLRGLHQHGAGRRLPRLRLVADHLRHRMRDGRAGAAARAWTRSRSAARTWCGPSDWIESVWKDPSDVDFGSYGLDQCLDLVEAALGQPAAAREARGRRLGGGHRHRAGDAGLRPADRAPLGRADGAAARRQLSPGRRLDRDGQRLGHLASADRRRGARRARRAASPSSTPTPIWRPTTPAPSPAPAPWSPARRWR